MFLLKWTVSVCAYAETFATKSYGDSNVVLSIITIKTSLQILEPNCRVPAVSMAVLNGREPWWLSKVQRTTGIFVPSILFHPS